MGAKSKLLLIDDEEPFCIITTNILANEDYIAKYALSAEDGLKLLENEKETDIVLLDINLGEGMSGIEALPLILGSYPQIQVIMITSVTELDIGLDCIKKGAFDYLIKPFQKEHFFKTIKRALERKKLIQLKDIFLEILVHDLRNPLQNITMGLEVINAESETIRKKAMNLARYGCWQIESMISNILNVAKFEKTASGLEYEKFCLEDELPKHIKPLVDRILFTDKKFQLNSKLPKGYELKTEKNLFFQVINNLLNNAVRFTRAGDIIKIELKKAGADILEVSVFNSGSFIDENMQDKIFDKYFKSIYYKQHEGRNFGLGLTFCNLACRALGGSIYVESSEKAGNTTFHFSIKNQK